MKQSSLNLDQFMKKLIVLYLSSAYTNIENLNNLLNIIKSLDQALNMI